MTNWKEISRTPGLSEEYIRKNANQLHWNSISHYQTLSEDFIREFADRVDWFWILRKQAISEEIVLQHLPYLLEKEWVLYNLPYWCSEKGWNYQRLTEAREMLRLLV